MLRVASGAFSICEGNLLYNDIPYRNIDLNHLRQRFSVIFSEDELIRGSILTNIKMGHPDVTINEVIAHAEKIGLMPFIQSQPLGFDTIVESTGKKIPKGVLVKILLLRAVLDNPALILAEDYWSTLEAAEKRRVIDYLFAPGNKSTMLISTNDIETAKRCDKIILLSNGTIVAEGKYEEIKNHPDYKKLNEFLSL